MSNPGRTNEPRADAIRASEVTKPPRFAARHLRRITKAQAQMLRIRASAGEKPDAPGDCALARPAAHQPKRERLADRLVKLARLRSEEEERARMAAEPACNYSVSDAVPLDRLGFMGLMLQPSVRIMPAIEPQPAVVALVSIEDATGHAAMEAPDASGAGSDIAALMAEYSAEAGSSGILPSHVLEPQRPIQAIALVSPRFPAASGGLANAGPEPLGPLDAQVLSSLDPIKRLAAALEAGAAMASAPMADTPAAAIIPAPAIAAPLPLSLQAAMPMPPAMAPSSGMPQGVPVARLRPPKLHTSAWPSFATGFAVALAFGVGLYIFLAGA